MTSLHVLNDVFRFFFLASWVSKTFYGRWGWGRGGHH